jgi:hypothetical protein
MYTCAMLEMLKLWRVALTAQFSLASGTAHAYQASSPSREYSEKAAASAHNILTRHMVPLVCKLLQLFVILCMLTIY